MVKPFSSIARWVFQLAVIALSTHVYADKMVLKDGTVIFGTITDEKDSLIKYFDRYDRPKKMVSAKVDTIQYDSKEVRGLVKVAFRKGQPKDRSGYFKIRHSEELDLEAEYRTDSISELDLFFRNNVHIRVFSGSRFKVIHAPKSLKDPLQLDLYSGKILATSPNADALARINSPFGVGVGRGKFQLGVVASNADSSVLVVCMEGLTGLAETLESPGELVVEKDKSVSITKHEGVFNRKDSDPVMEQKLNALAANMGHYLFSEVENPQIGYLPRAITGIGFMVFFYGSAIGILDYVNHI